MIGFFYICILLRLLYVDYDHYLRFHMSCILTEKKGGTEHNLRF